MSTMQERALDARYDQTPIAPGVICHTLCTDKFKKINLRAALRNQLGHDTAAVALTALLLGRGTTELPSQRAVTRYLEELFGASLVIDIIKIGEHQILLINLDIVCERYIDEPLLDAGVALLCSLLASPYRPGGSFPADMVSGELRNLRNVIEGKINDKASYANERCCEEMCAGEPYALYEYGSLEELDGLTAATMTEHYERLVASRRLDVFVTGAVEPQRVSALLHHHLTLDRRPMELPAGATGVAPDEPREVIEALPNLAQGHLIMGFRTSRTASDPDGWKLLLLNGLFGGYAHSRMFRRIREEAQMAYSAYTYLDKYKGVLLGCCGIEPARREECRDRVLAELASLQRGEISAEELETTRLALLRSYRLVLDSPAQTAEFHHGGLLSGRGQTIREAMTLIRDATVDDLVAAAGWCTPDTFYFLGPDGSAPGA